MEATKKTTTTSAALLVLAALSMLLSGLFIATASRSDATPPNACPDGFNLTADGKNCFQVAVNTSADNPNTCAEGLLTPDGSKCYVAARVLPQEGATACPKGYSPDDSLGGMCARFAAASQKDPGCPEGARGVAGACYIRIAKGPAGLGTCPTGQTLAGDLCVETGNAPTPGAGTCPVSTTVILDPVTKQCYSVITPASPVYQACDLGMGYVAVTANGSICKVSSADSVNGFGLTVASCPDPATTVPDHGKVIGTLKTDVTPTKVSSCSYTPALVAAQCTAAADLNPGGVPINGECRRSQNVVPGAATCSVGQTGFSLLSGKCVKYSSAIDHPANCPVGSAEANVGPDGGECRKPVANAAGAYYCKDATAALNGKSCVWTTGFLIQPSPDLFKCEKGARTVIGTNGNDYNEGVSGVQVICILGDADANLVTGPSCLQGVLSTDSLYCIVPRIDTAPAAAAAPVPSFTG